MKIRIKDDLPPEANAMLQALYSRSPASVDEHLEKVKAVGADNFMNQYYVGYGHKSIGDCGTTTIFIEGVPMLTAKAIQDNPLYNGQEASTRYMDFSKVEFSNPLGTPEGEAIQERWRAFYLDSFEPVVEALKLRYPQGDAKEGVWKRAIRARAFDILRAWLPAGAHTNMSWHTNLRQAADRLHVLTQHPHTATSDAAFEILGKLKYAYPSSFSGPLSEEAAGYLWNSFEEYFINVVPGPDGPGVDVHVRGTGRFRPEDFDGSIFEHRPRGVELPRWAFADEVITTDCILDYGSFRDLQRHRNGVIRMPLLNTAFGFHTWYLEQLPKEIADRGKDLLAQQTWRIDDMEISPVDRQDYIPMGFRTLCVVTQPLSAFVYRLELRSSKTVHPTLRQVVLEEIRQFRKIVGPKFALHVDESPDDWTVRRGTQTIEERTPDTDGDLEEPPKQSPRMKNALTEKMMTLDQVAEKRLAEYEVDRTFTSLEEQERFEERGLQAMARAQARAFVTEQAAPVPNEHPAAWDLVRADVQHVYEHFVGSTSFAPRMRYFEILKLIFAVRELIAIRGTQRTQCSAGELLGLVLEDMSQRDAFGKEKYGTRLQPFNGRDATIDVYQELLDAAVYTRLEMFELGLDGFATRLTEKSR